MEGGKGTKYLWTVLLGSWKTTVLAISFRWKERDREEETKEETKYFWTVSLGSWTVTVFALSACRRREGVSEREERGG